MTPAAQHCHGAATINGVTKPMILDTGSAASQLTDAVLREFNSANSKSDPAEKHLWRHFDNPHPCRGFFPGRIKLPNLPMQIDADRVDAGPFSG